jgi:hypothetical protein
MDQLGNHKISFKVSDGHSTGEILYIVVQKAEPPQISSFFIRVRSCPADIPGEQFKRIKPIYERPGATEMTYPRGLDHRLFLGKWEI